MSNFKKWLVNSNTKKDTITLENWKEQEIGWNIEYWGKMIALAGIGASFIGSVVQLRGKNSGTIKDFCDAVNSSKKETDTTEEVSE